MGWSSGLRVYLYFGMLYIRRYSLPPTRLVFWLLMWVLVFVACVANVIGLKGERGIEHVWILLVARADYGHLQT